MVAIQGENQEGLLEAFDWGSTEIERAGSADTAPCRGKGKGVMGTGGLRLVLGRRGGMQGGSRLPDGAVGRRDPKVLAPGGRGFGEFAASHPRGEVGGPGGPALVRTHIHEINQ